MSIQLHGIVQSNACGEGNKLFQYMTALIYAHKNNLYLLNGPSGISCVKINHAKINQGKTRKDSKDLKKVILSTGNFDKNNELAFYGHDKLYWITDFFQNANYFNQNYDIIMQYVETKPIVERLSFDYASNITPNDILCILRMGEMKGCELIHPDFYKSIFDKCAFNKIYFLIYPATDPDIEKYLSRLGKHREKVVLLNHKDKVKDFYCVKMFKYIALSISTFNWWSVFFDNLENKTVYTPKYFGYCRGSLRNHCRDLWNIKNSSIGREHAFN